MLSIGIRFGEGFDRKTLKELIEKGKMPFEYDFVVIGANAGGIAAAKEAHAAGKKVAIINWHRPSPAEEEMSILDNLTLFEMIGDFTDLKKLSKTSGRGSKSMKSGWLSEVDPELQAKFDEQMGKKGLIDEKSGRSSFGSDYTSYDTDWSGESSFTLSPTLGTEVPSPISLQKVKKWSRKLKKSKLDLKHAIHNLGHVGRKMMHCAAILKERFEDARNSGWRLQVVSPDLNWGKMSEGILDYIMMENWRLKNELHDKRIEYIDGPCTFLDDHRLKIALTNGGEREITAEKICAAVEAIHKIPAEIPGATKFGITSDDLIRLEEEPGRTLVVGATEIGIECAGIIAGFGFEVTMLSDGRVMEGFDREFVDLIVSDLRYRGVVILENSNISSIEHSEETNNLHVRYITMCRKRRTMQEEDSEEETGGIEQTFDEEYEGELDECEIEEEFDTVLFAIGTKIHTEDLEIRIAGVTPIPETEKIYAPLETTEVPHIYAVGDVLHERPENYAVAELAGQLLGKRIFAEETTLMDYDFVPMAVFAPIEYAFVGISEESAFRRFGDCIDVYNGHYQPLEFVLPERNTKCYLKVLVLKMNDWVIGMHMWGLDASEIMQGFASAFKCGLTNAKLRTTVGVHTSKAEKLVRLKKHVIDAQT